MNRALVIGKFYPPHLGHTHLINTALQESDHVIVLVCDSPAYTIPATTRQAWLQRIHPAADVQIIPDLADDDNSAAWAAHTIDFLGYAPDSVFSSEEYGIAYSKLMGSTHHMVDQQRIHVPISATRVRADIQKEWQYLHPIVKADLALRIAVVGAESTGTTTLAKQLAQTYDAPIALEYGRLYSESFSDHVWTNQEFVHIAQTQQSYEQSLASTSDGLVICDTNATATTLWQQRYMCEITEDVAAIARKDRVDLYVLTGDEIPFEQDGTRDGEHIRHDMHDTFEHMLNTQSVPHIVARGSKQARLKKARAFIDSHLSHMNTI